MIFLTAPQILFPIWRFRIYRAKGRQQPAPMPAALVDELASATFSAMDDVLNEISPAASSAAGPI